MPKAKSQAARLKAIEAQFSEFDASGDGAIDVDELAEAFKCDKATARKIVEKYDFDGSGTLDADEFKAAKAAYDDFQRFDKNHDGKITAKEVASAMHLKEKTAAKVLSEFDEDGSKTITFDEFSKFNAKVHEYEAMDADGDGHISEKELAKAMGLDKAQAKAAYMRADTSGKGGIDFGEFHTMGAVVEDDSGFGDLDLDGNGKLSLDELKAGYNLGDKEAKKIMKKYDGDKSGGIELAEFTDGKAQRALEKAGKQQVGIAGDGGSGDGPRDFSKEPHEKIGMKKADHSRMAGQWTSDEARVCRDVWMLVILALYCVGMLVIGGVAYTDGNMDELIRPVNSEGETCGMGKYKKCAALWFSDLPADVEKQKCVGVAKAKMTTGGEGVTKSGCPAAGYVCDIENEGQAEEYGSSVGCAVQFSMSKFVQASMVSGDAKINKARCKFNLFRTSEVLYRCMPNDTKVLRQITEKMNAGPWGDYIDEVKNHWKTIVSSIVFAAFFGFGWLFGLQVFTHIIVWTAIWGLLVLSFFSTSLGVLYSDWFEFGSEIDGLKAKLASAAKDAAAEAAKQLEDKQYEADMDAMQPTGTMREIFTVVSGVIFTLTLITVVALRKRVQIAIGVIEEAAHSMTSMPIMLGVPFVFLTMILILVPIGAGGVGLVMSMRQWCPSQDGIACKPVPADLAPTVQQWKDDTVLTSYSTKCGWQLEINENGKREVNDKGTPGYVAFQTETGWLNKTCKPQNSDTGLEYVDSCKRVYSGKVETTKLGSLFEDTIDCKTGLAQNSTAVASNASGSDKGACLFILPRPMLYADDL